MSLPGLAWLRAPVLPLLLVAAGLGACEPSRPPMNAPAPSTLTIALHEGFDADRVVIRSGGEVVADLPAVTTDVRIGLAEEVEVEVEGWPVAVEVAVPDRGLRGAGQVQAGQAVGVSVVGDRVVVRVSDAPFGYL